MICVLPHTGSRNFSGYGISIRTRRLINFPDYFVFLPILTPKAKNSLGQEGYIPETYVDLGGLSAAPAPLGVEAMNAINESSTTSTSTIVNNEEGSAPAATSPQEEVDTHQDNSDHQESQPSTEGLTSPDLQSPTSIQFPPDSASPYSSGDLEVQQTTGLTAPQAPAGAGETVVAYLCCLH